MRIKTKRCDFFFGFVGMGHSANSPVSLGREHQAGSLSFSGHWNAVSGSRHI